MAFSYDDWKKRNNSRKRPSVSAPIFSEFNARFEAEREASKPKQERWRSLEEFRRFSDTPQFDAQTKSQKARRTDSDRFAGRYISEQTRHDDKVKQVNADRFAGRYISEQARKDTATTIKPLVKPVAKKEEKAGLLSRVFENAKKLPLSDPNFHQRNYEMEHRGKTDMAKGFFKADNVNDTYSEKAGAGFRLGIGQTIEGIGDGVNWATSHRMLGADNLAGNAIKKVGQAVSKGFEDEQKEFKYSDWKNPDYLASSIPRAVPQLAVSLIPGLGTAAWASRIQKFSKLPKLAKVLLGNGVGAGVQTTIDSTLEAGGVYEESLRRGLSEEEAKRAGDEVFGKNLLLNFGTNFAELALMRSPLGKTFDGLNKGAQVGLRATGGALMEGLQEGAQEGITASALGDEFNWTDPSTVEAMFLGAILGGGVTGGIAGVGAVKDSLSKNPTPNVTELLERASNELPDNIREEFDKAVAELETEGVSREDALEIVSEQLLQREPAFEEMLTEITKQYIADKKLEMQSTEKNPISKEEENLLEAQTTQPQQPLDGDTPQASLDIPTPIQNTPLFDPGASLDGSIPQGNINTPPMFEMPVQASNEVKTPPVNVAVGDTVNLEGTRPETEYLVEGVEGDSVQLLTPNKVSIKVPKSKVVNVLNRRDKEDDVNLDVNLDKPKNADKPWEKKPGEYNKAHYDEIVKKLQPGATQEDYWDIVKKAFYSKGRIDYPEAKNIEDVLFANGLITMHPSNRITLTKEDEDFHKESVARNLTSKETDKVARYEDWKRIGREFVEKYDMPTAADYARLFSRVSTQAKEHGKATLVSDMYGLVNIDGIKAMFQDLMDNPELGTAKVKTEEKITLARRNKTGKSANPEDRPQGLYMSIVKEKDGYVSPFEDVGDVTLFGTLKAKNPLILDELIAEHARFGWRESGYVSSGISALHQLVGEAEFKKLMKLSKSEVKKLLEEQFPGPDYSRYHDAYDLLEAYAAQLARTKGYDAFILEDKRNPEFSEVAVLNNSALEYDKESQITEKVEDVAKSNYDEGYTINLESAPDKQVKEYLTRHLSYKSTNKERTEWKPIGYERLDFTVKNDKSPEQIQQQFKKYLEKISKTDLQTEKPEVTESGNDWLNTLNVDDLVWNKQKKQRGKVRHEWYEGDDTLKVWSSEGMVNKVEFWKVKDLEPYKTGMEKEQFEYSKEFTHILRGGRNRNGLKVRTFIEEDGSVKWIDEEGHTGSDYKHTFSGRKILKGEELKAQKAKEAEIAKAIKKKFAFDPKNKEEAFPRGIFSEGIVRTGKPTGPFTNEESEQYRQNEITILSLMSDEDILNYVAMRYIQGGLDEDSRMKDNKEELKKYFFSNLKNFGTHSTFMEYHSPYGFKNKIQINTGDGRTFTPTFNEMWKRFSELIKDVDTTGFKSEKAPSPKENEKSEEEYTVTRFENGVPVFIAGINFTKDGANSYAEKMNKTNSYLVNGATYKVEVTTKELEKRYAEEKAASKPEPTNVLANETNKYDKMRDRLDFTTKAAEAARKRLAARRNTTLYSGLPMNDMIDYSIIGMDMLAHKMIDLAEFTEGMVKEFGESVRDWVPGIYGQSMAMLDYDEDRLNKMLQDAYNDDSMTLIDEEESTSPLKEEKQETSEYANLDNLEPKHKKRSARNGQFSKDEIIMFDLLTNSEIPSFLKAIFADTDPRLVYDLYLKLMVSRGREVKINGKEFNELYNATSDSNIEDYRKTLLGYGRGLDENGEIFQVLMDVKGTVYVSYTNKELKSKQLSFLEFEEAMNKDEYSFGKANRPLWVDNLEGFLDDLRKRQGGKTNVSNIIGTGSVSNGTSTGTTSSSGERGSTQEVSPTGGKRNNGSNERTNDGLADGVSDSRGEPSEGPTGDTITSPSNHGNPNERVIPVDHVITENIYEPNAKKRFENNIKALEILKTLETENRHGTASELEILAKYQGWGGLSEYFDRSKPQYEKLQEHVNTGLITKEEYGAMQKTVITSFYTSHEIAKKMYDVLLSAGFNGGKILESSVGTGMFLGALPQLDGKHKFETVEIDGLSHRITSKLYPKQKHHHKGFQVFSATEGSFDLVIGNVPFSDAKILDGTYTDSKLGTKKNEKGERLPKGKLDHKGRLMKYATHNTHDYFLVKNLDLLKEGGLGMLITSSTSLDSVDWDSKLVREYMEEHTDFFEAIRLPNDAFKHAGTSVTTDILFFRKKVTGSKAKSSPIINVGNLNSENGGVKGKMNEYFLAKPDQITGELKQGTRWGDQVIVTMDNFDKRMKKAISHVKKIFKGKFVPGEVNDDIPVKVEGFINEKWATEKVGVFEGAIHERNGTFIQYEYKQWKMYPVEKENIQKLKDVLAVRDSYLALIVKEEDKSIPSEQMIKERQTLNETYDKFVKAHGEMNKKGVLTPFEKDVRTVALLRALEKQEGKKWEKVALFKDRQKFPDIVLEKKGDVQQALNLSLIHRGELDLNIVSNLLNMSKEDTIDKLEAEGHIFFDPQEQAYVTDDEYLSGNIAKKLALAKAKDLQKNIAALEKILPPQLSIEQIADGIRFGQGWIPKEVYQEFVEKTLGVRNVLITHNFATATWGVKVGNNSISYKNTETYAIKHRHAKKDMTGIQVIEKLMNLKSPKPPLDKTDEMSKSVEAKAREEILNVTNRVVEQLQNELKAFIIGHPTYNERLTKMYNDTFTSVVPRVFDGERMYGTDEKPVTIPNLNPVYKLYKHQKDAVMRVLRSQNSLLAHVVGAGKTLEMQVSIMEGRRLGIIKKPMMVVPLFMVEQHAREFQHAYPNAKIKVITTGKTENDISGIKVSRNAKWSDAQFEQETEKNRALRFRSLADVKYGDYDVVIMSYTSFERISLDIENEKAFIHREVETLRSFLQDLVKEDGSSPTVKEIEKAIEKLEIRLEELAERDKKDVAMSFEEIGIDALFVDEAQSYKNLQYHTKLGSVGGLPNSTSKRALDMYMKTFVMNKQGGRTVFATGTPISNSMAEMFTILRYLAPDVLEEQGMAHFDGWAQLFGTTENSVELNTAGKFVERTRFSKFTNVGELMRIFKSFADVKMADDLPYLKRPKAERITIKTGMSEKQTTYLELMVKRAGNIAEMGILPAMDNLLKLTSEGKKLALDYRLFDGSSENDVNSKLNRIANEVAEEYKATATGNNGIDPKTGEAFTFDNGTQIIFMDLGVPKATDKPKEDDMDDDIDTADASMYQNLKDRLLELGVKNEHIAVIHDYKKPEQKKKLSELFNEGKIRVLIGSTGKMGVGMNLQKRLTTLHHADPTWRPSDIEQREGRIVRQGNFNENVKIKTYVTEGSFDALMWNILENKAKFIAQVMSGGTEIRSMEEIAELIMSFSEIKAEATGNQSAIDLMKTEKEIRELQLAQREDIKRKARANKVIAEYEKKKAEHAETLVFTQRIEGKAKSTRAEKFHLVLGKETFTDRTEGTTALRDKVLNIRKEARNKEYSETIGELGGVPILALGRKETNWRTGESYLAETVILGEIIDDSATGYGWIPMVDFLSSEGRGTMSRLENIVIGLSSKTYSPGIQDKLDDLDVGYKEAQEVVAQPSEDTSKLRQLENDVIALREQALQHELTNTFDTVFSQGGKKFVVSAIDYREVPSKNKKKLKEDKPDYEIDIVFAEITDITLSSEPDVFGENNETEYEIYTLGERNVLPIIDFIRDYNRANNHKGVTTGVAKRRRIKAEEKRQEAAQERARKNDEDSDSGVSSLLDTERSGGTDQRVSPKTAKKVGDLLANALDTVLHSGYVEGRRGKKKGKSNGKTLGTYNFNKGTGNILGAHIHDLRVVAHELGHAFEQFVGLDTFEDIRSELEKVAVKLYPNGAELEGDDKMKEGLAELFQLYVIDPVASEQLAPTSFRFLQQFVEGDPTLKEAFAESSKLIAHEMDGTAINKVLGSINFADDSHITKNIGNEYSIRGGEDATKREKIKGWIKEQLFELVDFKIPWKDMGKELKKQGYAGLDMVKKLTTIGVSRERARHEFVSWASDKYGRKIINYKTVEELPSFLHGKYDELMSGVYTGDHDYVKRFKKFLKTDTKERAALKALSSRSFQEISIDGINHVEENLRKRKEIPKELQRIIDRLDTTIEGKKKKVPSYRIFSAIAQSYRYKERSERVDKDGNKKFENNPINASDADKLIAFSRAYFPQLENLIEEYTNNLSEVLLTKSVEGGLITQKTKEIVKKGSKFYIPTYYATKFTSLDGNDTDRKSAGQPLHEYDGKQEIVLDLLQATINKLTEVEAAVEFKGVMDILQDSLKTKGMGKFGSFINPGAIPHIVSGKQIEPQLIDFIEESTGVDASEMEGSLSDAVFAIYVKADKFKTHEPILINWTYDKNGKAKQTYMKVAPDLYNSIISMQPLQIGLYMRNLSKTSSVFRYLALANVKYLITAFQRDLSTAFLQRDSKGGIYTYIKNTLKGAAYAAGIDQKVVDQYMASGAFSSNSENILKSFSRQSTTDGLLPDGSKMFGLIPTGDPSLWKTKKGKLIKLINPSTYLSWGEAIFRYGEFNATVNEMLAEEGIEFSYEDFMDGSVKLDRKDLPAIERILLEAGYRASKITVPFNNHGRDAKFREAIQPISFLHGFIQGSYREAEEIKEHGFNKSSKRLTYRTIGTLLPMTLATWALSRAFGDDEEEIPSEMRDKNWMIWMPWGYYAWAKPFAYSLPLAYIERFLDDVWGEEGARKYNEDVLNPLKAVAHFPYMPILFNTISDLYHNETWYGGEIVPHYQEEGPDFQEFDEKTSTLAKKQAELMFKWRNKLEGVKDVKDANYEYGISPKKFDYAITSLFGKWGAAFLETVGGKPKGDALVFGSMITGEDEIRSRSVDKFYKKAENVAAAHQTFGVKYKPDAETKMFTKFKDSMKGITELQKAIHASPNLSKAQKSEMNLNLVRAKRDIARFGIKIEPKDKENVVKTLKLVEDYQRFLDSQEED